ncbi:hypothetical protein [Streptacidiphilus rugosus]|uniref:hypothetical protein n=1 Tax=Streptacidiphilus rugosus TaxID=405783 RepID=UPI0005631BCA|nr:hypothetical protein [Streptacidiphilus rugosus]
MIALLHRWLYEDLWLPMWPNVFAPSMPSLLAIAWHHLQLRRHVTNTAAAHCPGCTCGGEHP